jgi:hypothetical protein
VSELSEHHVSMIGSPFRAPEAEEFLLFPKEPRYDEGPPLPPRDTSARWPLCLLAPLVRLPAARG